MVYGPIAVLIAVDWTQTEAPQVFFGTWFAVRQFSTFQTRFSLPGPATAAPRTARAPELPPGTGR